TDFGISHAAGDVTVTSTGLLGTPAFLAPEVARGEAPSPASDVFSLGATLYAAVDGVPPFGTSDNPIAQLHRVAGGGPPPPPRSACPVPGLPAAMRRDEPTSRPSMARAAADLETIATAGVPLAAAPTTALVPAGRLGAPVAAAPPTQIDAQPVRTRSRPRGAL